MPERINYSWKFFALFTKTTKKFHQNVQEIRTEHYLPIWYRNFAQGDVHISFGGKI